MIGLSVASAVDDRLTDQKPLTAAGQTTTRAGPKQEPLRRSTKNEKRGPTRRILCLNVTNSKVILPSIHITKSDLLKKRSKRLVFVFLEEAHR